MTVKMSNSSTGNHSGTPTLGSGRDLPKPRNHSDSSEVQSVEIRILIFQRDPVVCFFESLTTSKDQPEEPHSPSVSILVGLKAKRRIENHYLD